MNDVQLSSLIRDHASKHKATDRLRAELRTRAVLVDAARPGRDVTLHQQAGWSTWLQTFGGKWLAAWRYLAVGAGGGVMASVGIGFLVFHLQVGTLAGGDLVAAHVRAMRDGPLVQVVSTDQHTVKPWFQGKLDFAPPVVDLIDAGYALLGGRVEDFRGRPVAALAYSRDQHIINLFIEPDTATQPPKRDVVNGFNVLRWSDGVMRYALVGNIGVAEAEQFPKLWQTAWQSEQKQLPHSSLPVVSRPPPGSMQGGWLVNAKVVAAARVRAMILVFMISS